MTFTLFGRWFIIVRNWRVSVTDIRALARALPDIIKNARMMREYESPWGSKDAP